MESLNYTDLASWVLVLGIVSLFTLYFQIFLIVNLRRLRRNLVESKQEIEKNILEHFKYLKDLRNQDVEQIISTQEDVKNLNTTIQHKAQICIELEHKFERLEKKLIKPKFKIGDTIKHVFIEGIKGKVINIDIVPDGFEYTIKDRGYFGRKPREYVIREYNSTLVK